MGTLGETVVVDELGISLLSPTLRCLVNLFGEGAYGDRDLDASRVEESSCQIVAGGPREGRGGKRGGSQPIKSGVVREGVPPPPRPHSVLNTHPPPSPPSNPPPPP